MSTLVMTQRPRTLIADDQPDVRVALRLLLKGAGFQTEAADSPKGVLDAIRKSDFDVVLMDLNYARDTTSGQEGLDLISRIQAQDHSLPIVVMTAWGTVDLAVEAMRRGVRDFVQKPWENSRLVQVLRTQVQQGRTRRKLRQKASQRSELNRRLQRELREAREIQRRLMPPPRLRFDTLEISCSWRAARAIGGDYLAAFPISERLIALCAADVAGKGLPAALMMSNLQATVKSTALQTTEPREVCTQLNRLIYRNIPANKFISNFYGVLDFDLRILRFTNAGQNSPVLIRSSGELLRLETGGRVLGAFAESIYTQNEVQLRPGDRLFLFTDGITEARNDSGEEFGEARLCELVALERRRSAAALQSVVMDSVRKFCQNQFDDDAALMIVEIK